MSEEFDQTYWEERYRSHSVSFHAETNPQVVAEAADLAPGTALEAGCGEGGDAIWLASRGWRVTAVDIAPTALRRGREQAESAGVAGIEWVHADLTAWTPAAEHFDLVTASYVHPVGPSGALFGKLAAAVTPGGTLLIVGHHPTDPHSLAHGSAGMGLTAAEVANDLDPDRWDIVVADTRIRSLTVPDGREVTFHDTVLRARKRP
ncbi:class I SAM-dependent methyltransferase [Actinokineospora sp. 24-640]